MDGGFAWPTTTDTNAFGHGAESVIHVGRRLRSCPIGWRQLATTAFPAGSRPVNTSPPVILPSKPHRTAKTRRTCPINLPCADGRIGDSSACGAGLRLEPSARSFYEHPPSLPGISARSAVFCQSRQEVRESSNARRIETADSVDGLSANA